MHVNQRRCERDRVDLHVYPHRKKGGLKRQAERIKKLRVRLVYLFFSHKDQYWAMVELRRMNKHGILDKFILLLERLVENESQYPARYQGRHRHHKNSSNGSSEAEMSPV